MNEKEILRLENISKCFSSNYVLQEVNFSLCQGEVRALVGENGAGKSTMIKIVSGAIQANGGQIYLEGKQISFGSPKESLAAGISVMYQELDLVSNLTIAENIFLGIEERDKWKMLDQKKMKQDVQKHLEDMGLQVDPESKVGELPIVMQQMVAAIKAMVHRAKVLIMDEPSSSLTNKELTVLFDLIRKLKKQGIAVIYVSHRLEEIFEICDSVSVLLNGKMVATSKINDITKDQVIEKMIGKKVVESRLNTRTSCEGEYIFEAEHLNSKEVLKDISFKVKQGEIYGILGLVGSGAVELGKALYGVQKITGGKIKIHGKDVNLRGPSDAIKNSISYVSDERRAYGIFKDMDVEKNTVISSLSQFLSFRLLRLLDRKKIREKFQQYTEEFHTKISGPDQKIRYLSGGNQQKILIARALVNNTDIIILSSPTKGIDVGAKYEIYQILLDCASAGKTVIVISQEITELVQICDRVLMLKQGKVFKEYSGESVRESLIYNELLS